MRVRIMVSCLISSFVRSKGGGVPVCRRVSGDRTIKILGLLLPFLLCVPQGRCNASVRTPDHGTWSPVCASRSGVRVRRVATPRLCAERSSAFRDSKYLLSRQGRRTKGLKNNRTFFKNRLYFLYTRTILSILVNNSNRR